LVGNYWRDYLKVPQECKTSEKLPFDIAAPVIPASLLYQINFLQNTLK